MEDKDEGPKRSKRQAAASARVGKGKAMATSARGRSAAHEAALEEEGGDTKARKRRRSKSPFDAAADQDMVVIVLDEEGRADGAAVAVAPPAPVALVAEVPAASAAPPPQQQLVAVAMSKEEQQQFDEAEAQLRQYWDRSFEEPDTIDRIREGEARNMEKRKEIPWLAELVGVDLAADAKDPENRGRWTYQLKSPLVEAYVNIGRSHDHYIYPLHVDLASATRSNIISRLHASLRFDVETQTWVVQVFGRNGVEFPSHGWVMPAECDDDVWRGLRGYNNFKFTIGEVEFHIYRNPNFSSEKQIADWCRRLEGQLDSDSNSGSKHGSPVDRTLVDCFVDSAEEDEDGKDPEIQLEFARTKVPSVPARGTTGQIDPDQKVIDDGDELNLLNLLVRYPLPTESELSAGTGVLKKARLRQGEACSNNGSAALASGKKKTAKNDDDEGDDEDDEDDEEEEEELLEGGEDEYDEEDELEEEEDYSEYEEPE